MTDRDAADHPRGDGELTLERIAPGVAAGRIDAAIELTEMTLDPPVSDDYARLRALARLRVDEVSHFVPVPERDELPHEERDRLRDEFLSSPEGKDFAPDSDEVWAMSLAIDFCADYVDGRPLRWSPVVVELFMANWIPRKVLADKGLFARLPTALDAWVRFAGPEGGHAPLGCGGDPQRDPALAQPDGRARQRPSGRRSGEAVPDGREGSRR